MCGEHNVTFWVMTAVVGQHNSSRQQQEQTPLYFYTFTPEESLVSFLSSLSLSPFIYHVFKGGYNSTRTRLTTIVNDTFTSTFNSFSRYCTRQGYGSCSCCNKLVHTTIRLDCAFIALGVTYYCHVESTGCSPCLSKRISG